MGLERVFPQCFRQCSRQQFQFIELITGEQISVAETSAGERTLEQLDALGLLGEMFEGHAFFERVNDSAPLLGSRAATFAIALQRQKLVPTEGVEPTHPYGYQILSLARLPIPPHRPPSQEYIFSAAQSKSISAPGKQRGAFDPAAKLQEYLTLITDLTAQTCGRRFSRPRLGSACNPNPTAVQKYLARVETWLSVLN